MILIIFLYDNNKHKMNKISKNNWHETIEIYNDNDNNNNNDYGNNDNCTFGTYYHLVT